MTYAYLTEKERREVILDVGDNALILYEHYINKGNIKDYEFTDLKNANALGWKESKAKRLRWILQQNGYIHTAVFTHSTTRRVTHTYIGKDNVTKFKKDVK